ncbi:MAG: hypothetical protein QM396_03560 [Euryarchaeota archaeon]|jgi:metal-responsive CopG/Arc/MetJ family transcriptional regulator|nr:hypothetical protein [Euryarchaeota archaeon]
MLYKKNKRRIEKMERICVTLPPELVNELDAILKENGYHSRTTGIQEAIEDYIYKLKS